MRKNKTEFIGPYITALFKGVVHPKIFMQFFVLSFRCLATILVHLAVGGSGREHLHVACSSSAWRYPGVPVHRHLPFYLHAGLRTHTAASGGRQRKANSLATIHASFSSSARCVHELIKCQSVFWMYKPTELLLEKTSR